MKLIMTGRNMPKLTKLQKDKIHHILQLQFDEALFNDKILLKVIDSKPTYLGSEKYFNAVAKRIIKVIELRDV